MMGISNPSMCSYYGTRQILSSYLLKRKRYFYIQHTSLGKDWQVVQKFEHRNIYDVAEKDEGSHDVHQDDYHSNTEHVVQEGGDDVPLPNIQGGEATIIEGNLQELIRNKKEAAIIDVDSVGDSHKGPLSNQGNPA
jgi:hypothetical protein